MHQVIVGISMGPLVRRPLTSLLLEALVGTVEGET